MGDHSEREPGEVAAPAAVPGWWATMGELEPVRRALWPVAIAVVALLGGYGVLTDELGLLWLGVAAAVLGIGGAEVARSSAWAPESVDEVRHATRRQALEQLEERTAQAYELGVQTGIARVTGRAPVEVVQDAPMTVEHAPPTREIAAVDRPAPS